MYLIEIKEKTIASNQAARELAEEHGTTIEFDSREEAEELARKLSREGERVRIQKAAQLDPSNVDGYLVRFPRRFHHEPKESRRAGLTFDVDANLYGELGRAVVIGSYGISPAVRYYIFHELGDFDEETHWLRRIFNPDIHDDDVQVSWSPDCLIKVYHGETGEVVGDYFCEIKTGKASFQRGQLEDMREVSKTFNVLKIRVYIENLPDEYTVQIEQVQPT